MVVILKKVASLYTLACDRLCVEPLDHRGNEDHTVVNSRVGMDDICVCLRAYICTVMRVHEQMNQKTVQSYGATSEHQRQHLRSFISCLHPIVRSFLTEIRDNCAPLFRIIHCSCIL